MENKLQKLPSKIFLLARKIQKNPKNTRKIPTGLESTLKWKYTPEISDQIIFSSQENQKYSEKIPKNIRKFPQCPEKAVDGK